MAGRAREDWGCSKENKVAIVLEIRTLVMEPGG